MSLLAISCIVSCIVFFLALAWLGVRPLSQETQTHRGDRIEGLVAHHTQHFPQLRQSLAGVDRRYVRRVASKQAEKNWRHERRQILESFLQALGEDFARLQELALLAKEMLPEELGQEGAIPLGLQLQFRVNYRVASLLMSVEGPASTRRITRLAELLTNISTRAEANMARLTSTPTLDSRRTFSNIEPD